MHCSSDACAQGKKSCPTPSACGSEVMGGTYWPLLANSEPHIAPQDDEPLSFCAKACWAGAVTVAAVIVAAGIVDWLMSF